jgi:formate hydrogenlyase subunit 6/NADH:ubiquinone oxidoreductase subunit I
MSFTGTALKNLFSKPATTEYPAVPREYPQRTRGHVKINIDDCILCGMCMRNCPPGAIKVDRASGTWTIQRFDCVQCGYCTVVCPKKCLEMVPGYTEPQPDKMEETIQKPVIAKPADDKAKVKTADHVAATNEKEVPQADEAVCVYCTLCAKKCPAGAITVNREAKEWSVDEEACIGCGLCATNCPKKCIQMK